MQRFLPAILLFFLAPPFVAAQGIALPPGAYSISTGGTTIGSAQASASGIVYTDDPGTDPGAAFPNRNFTAQKAGNTDIVYNWTYYAGEDADGDPIFVTWTIKFFANGTWQSFKNGTAVGSGTYTATP